MTPRPHAGSIRHGRVRWLVRAIALTFAFRGGVAAAQSDARENGSRPAAPGADGGLAADIGFAVLPLPEQMRAGATVMRLDSTQRPVVVRQGTNGMVCMRFVPGDDAWDARCYDITMFQAIMHVGELQRLGLTRDSLRARINAEVRAGTLTFPNHPTAGYRVLGGPPAYNPMTGAVAAYMESWQLLHVPFATAKDLGLPDESDVSDARKAQMPYVMLSGSWAAHVMIEHPKASTSKR